MWICFAMALPSQLVLMLTFRLQQLGAQDGERPVFIACLLKGSPAAAALHF